MWDRRRLHDALVTKGYEQLRPLVERLLNGHKINVLILGDSIVEFHAGRYPPGSPRISPYRFIYDTQAIEEDEQHHTQAQCSDQLLSWGRSFMSLINETYPNANHHIFNLGISASNFLGWRSVTSCGNTIPSHVDLMVLEHLPLLESSETAALDAELLLHVLWGHLNAPLPAVLFMNLYRTPGGVEDYYAHMNDTEAKRRVRMRSCVGSVSECPKCAGLFDNLPDEAMSKAESETHRVASHYGMASWSHRNFLEGLMKEGIPNKYNLSSCEFFASLYLDGTHPRELQNILFADVLFDYIQTAVELLGNTSAAASPPGLVNISSPIYKQSDAVPTAKCFNALLKESVLPGGHHLTPMNITLANGWSLVEIDGGRVRPGWIGNSTGARLRISLPIFQSSPSMFDISLTYLRSYIHMGQVNVTCIRPSCQCEHPSGVILNGHLPGTNKVSIPETAKIRVTVPVGSHECTVELEIVSATDSGEHKFKLTQAGIGGYIMDFPKQLEKLAKEHEELVA